MEVTLPVGIQADIDDTFSFSENESYQKRAHAYLERYEVCRGYRDTAVQATVLDIARRAFSAGAEGRGASESVRAVLVDIAQSAIDAVHQIDEE